MGTESKPSFWTTVPGILTGIAAVVTAATGLYLAVRATSDGDADVLSKASETSSSVTSTSPPFVLAGSQDVPPPREYELQEGGKLPDKPPFLRVKEFAYGSSHGGPNPDLRKIELVITNTSAEPILLDLTDRFFSLADDLGRRAELIGFCCDAQGELLSPGESRTATVFFKSPEGWYGKSLAADEILFRVQGLLPVERATWSFQPLFTAE